MKVGDLQFEPGDLVPAEVFTPVKLRSLRNLRWIESVTVAGRAPASSVRHKAVPIDADELTLRETRVALAAQVEEMQQRLHNDKLRANDAAARVEARENEATDEDQDRDSLPSFLG